MEIKNAEKYLKILRDVLVETDFGAPTPSDGFLFLEVESHMRYLFARLKELEYSHDYKTANIERALGYRFKGCSPQSWTDQIVEQIKLLKDAACIGEEGSISE